MILAIEDDGPGFPAELIEHVFERHAKGHHSSGHGLGLAFVDAVVRAHGGTVTASNCESRGAMITIRLPLTGSLDDSNLRRKTSEQVATASKQMTNLFP
jgi:signal transduction histidine kinase